MKISFSDYNIVQQRYRSRYSSVSIVTKLRFQSGTGNFSRHCVQPGSRNPPPHPQPPIQWVPGALSLGVKQPGREVDYSHPLSAEVTNALLAWCLIKQWIRLRGLVLS
jgi:hypothetical protein